MNIEGNFPLDFTWLSEYCVIDFFHLSPNQPNNLTLTFLRQSWGQDSKGFEEAVKLIRYQKGVQKMNKLLEKIKNIFSCKCEKKEEPKPQQEEPKAQEKPKEQK